MSPKHPDADPKCQKCGGFGATLEECGCGGNKPHHVCLPTEGEGPACLVTCPCVTHRQPKRGKR